MSTQDNISLSVRFINAYNTMDHTLRSIYNFKKSMTFTDVVRRSVMYNSVVRKYEDDLLDYGRLRNAIVHRTNPNYVIAEPHQDVVEKFEKIADIISTPPLAIDRVSLREVITQQHNKKIADVMVLIYQSGYSNIPILEGSRLIGMVNSKSLLELIGKKLSEKVDINKYAQSTDISEVLLEQQDRQYTIEGKTLTIESALRSFEANRKLLAILITEDGNAESSPIGIITVADVVEMQSILNVY